MYTTVMPYPKILLVQDFGKGVFVYGIYPDLAVV
jgi:hypothetical protein